MWVFARITVKSCLCHHLIFYKKENMTKLEKYEAVNKTTSLKELAVVSDNSIVIPKPKLKFEGLDNITIVGENDIPLAELFELHLKLENYLKSRPESIVSADGNIVGFDNYH